MALETNGDVFPSTPHANEHSSWVASSGPPWPVCLCAFPHPAPCPKGLPSVPVIRAPCPQELALHPAHTVPPSHDSNSDSLWGHWDVPLQVRVTVPAARVLWGSAPESLLVRSETFPREGAPGQPHAVRR